MKTLWMQRRWLTMYSALFLLVAALGYGTMLRSGHAMLWKLDGVGQYWPTFVYIGRYFQRFVLGLLHGQWLLPAFDLSIGMGDDIIGVLNYYGFGDPLNILAVFVTDTNSPYLFTAMFFLRLYLAGLAFIAYCRCMRLDSCAAVPAALCYVFCGYAIFGGAMYQGWLSTLIYFPLILTGYEITLRGDRRTWLLPLAVAYGALCGYYFLYMCSLCLGAYAAVRSIAIRGRLPVQTLVRRHCFAAAAYVAGLLLAAPIMVPALLEFLGSERRGAFLPQSIFTAEMLTPHSPLLLARMLFDRSVPNMLVNYLYNATRLAAVAALLLPALAHWRRNWRSQEGQCLAALLIAVVALHFPATDYVFNAFVKSFQGDTLRWTFIIHFLLAVILAVVLTGMNDIQDRWKDTWHIHLAGRTLPKWGIAAAASCLVLFELVSGIRALYEGHGFKAGFASTATASVYLASPASVSRTIAADSGLFRISHTPLSGVNGRPENVAMLHQYYGLAYWFSVVNGYVMDFAHAADQERNKNWRAFGFSTPAHATASGVKYHMAESGTAAPAGYIHKETVTFNGHDWNIFENPDYSGMAYLSRTGAMEGAHAVPDVRYDNIKNRISSNFENSSGAHYLTLRVPYSPNWRATVDGKTVPTRMLKAPFLSIPVAPGAHHAILTYSRRPMYFGLACMLLAIVFVLRTAFVARRTPDGLLFASAQDMSHGACTSGAAH